ncbi:uncharacterized protein BKA78DRAFT_49962 [Phyllosticta capitalensis]|uniref:uncharacterized protein n=1 Tax=Phyllosticta capitalensis TaxID=121624 RepID=UPI00312EF7B8
MGYRLSRMLASRADGGMISQHRAGRMQRSREGHCSPKCRRLTAPRHCRRPEYEERRRSSNPSTVESPGRRDPSRLPGHHSTSYFFTEGLRKSQGICLRGTPCFSNSSRYWSKNSVLAFGGQARAMLSGQTYLHGAWSYQHCGFSPDIVHDD